MALHAPGPPTLGPPPGPVNEAEIDTPSRTLDRGSRCTTSVSVEARRCPVPVPGSPCSPASAPKSSGLIWSRNSLNRSTSSSCSSSMTMPASVEDVLRAEDRRPGAQGQRDRVGRAGADLDSGGEHQQRVEDTVAQLGDPDLHQLDAERLEHVAQQVVRHRPGRHHTLLGERDGGRLDGTDPDRQVALPRDLAEQDDRLVRRHLDPNPDDVERLHAPHHRRRLRRPPGP